MKRLAGFGGIRRPHDAVSIGRTHVAVLCVGVVGALAACGGNGDENASTDGPVAPEALAEARSVVEKASQAPRSIGVDVPLEATPTPGKRIIFLYPNTPSANESLSGVKDAAEMLGFDLHAAPLGATQDETRSVINSAIQTNPDGVILSNVDPSFITKELKDWKARKIPVVDWGTTLENDGNQVNFVRPDFVNENETQMIDWAVADANGEEVKMLFVGFNGVPCCSSAAPVLEARLKQLCPGCEFSEMVMPLTDIGTAAPGKIVSFLQTHPDYNYVALVVGDLAIGLPAALASAGLQDKVKFISAAGGKTNFGYIQRGQQAADLSWGTVDIGWAAVDAVARGMQGQDLAPAQQWVVPTRLVTKETLDFDINKPFPGVPDKAAQWEELWKVDG